MEKLHDEFQNLYCLPNIVRVIKSRRVGWPGHITCMEWREVYTKVYSEILKGRDHFC